MNFREALNRARTAPRRRWWKNPTLLITAVVMVLWTIYNIGGQTPTLVALVAMVTGAMWLLKNRRDIALSIVIAAVTTAAPMVAVIVVLADQLATAEPTAGILTGFILAGPLPTLLAWAQQPLTGSRVVAAASGSAALLVGTALVTVLGDHGVGVIVLAVSLLVGCAIVVLGHRRRLHRLLQELPWATEGWTDLGRRVLPSGRVADVRIGHGLVVCATTTHSTTVRRGSAIQAMNAAVETAQALRISPAQVRPILIAPDADTSPATRAVQTEARSAVVTITRQVTDLDEITAQAPQHGRSRPIRNRKVLAAAATLPLSGETR